MAQHSPVTLRAYAKINLFLHVVGRRDDGYHLLESIFELIDWFDELTLEALTEPSVIREGDVVGDARDDLVRRAALALQATPQWAERGRPGARLGLTKNIPSGAGLGGGSSDAASTLWGLNGLWGLGLSRAQLAEIGLALGADVPFFLFGGPAFAQGVGEKLTPIDPVERFVTLVIPRVNVATSLIFKASELTRTTKKSTIADFADAVKRPVWVFGHNDLQPVTCLRFPEVQRVVDRLKQAAESEQIDPEAVRMSGSGGAVLVTSPSLEQAKAIRDRMEEYAEPADRKSIASIRVCKTLERHPDAV